MSIKLMSAIFATKFRDLKDATGNVTKASTATLVLLALADHANDDGRGRLSEPGQRWRLKTELSRTTIVSAYKALMYNGIITLRGQVQITDTAITPSIVNAFPGQGRASILVKPGRCASPAT